VSAMIDVTVQSAAWEKLPRAEAAVRRAIEATLRNEQKHDGEIGIVLTDDAHIQALNRDFRETDKPTNVLAFPAPKQPGESRPPIGDIVLAYETLAREAAAEKKPIEHHLVHLAVHGMLHLLGFDHMNDADAETMETHERAILVKLGIPDPYAAREDAGAAA